MLPGCKFFGPPHLRGLLGCRQLLRSELDEVHNVVGYEDVATPMTLTRRRFFTSR